MVTVAPGFQPRGARARAAGRVSKQLAIDKTSIASSCHAARHRNVCGEDSGHGAEWDWVRHFWDIYEQVPYSDIASCGACGGTGCSGFPGGSSNCCVGNITSANSSCATHNAPCVLDP